MRIGKQTFKFEKAYLKEGAAVVGEKEGGIALVGQNSSIPAGYIVKAGEQVDNDSVKEAR